MSLDKEVVDIISENLITQRADYIQLLEPIIFSSSLCGVQMRRGFSSCFPTWGSGATQGPWTRFP